MVLQTTPTYEDTARAQNEEPIKASGNAAGRATNGTPNLAPNNDPQPVPQEEQPRDRE